MIERYLNLYLDDPHEDFWLPKVPASRFELRGVWEGCGSTPAGSTALEWARLLSQLLHSLETAAITIHTRSRCIIAAVPTKSASARNRKSRA